MRHQIKGRKFGRTRKQRSALLSNLAVSLIEHDTIETTEAKAKELRPYIEKMISRARKNDIASRRIIASRLRNNETAVKKLFDVVAKKYTDRPGGYTRIIKLPARFKDNASLAKIEFV